MDDHFNGAGFKIRIGHPLRPGLHRSPDTQHVFAAYIMGLPMDSRITLRIKNDLAEAFTIPQINKYNAAVIPSSLDPSHQDDFPADIFRTQLIAVMGPSQITEWICHEISPFYFQVSGIGD